MSKRFSATNIAIRRHAGWWLLLVAMSITMAVYSAGLSGSFLFDDYPNIVDNHGVQPHDASLPSLVGAALSSPSSEFKRPLASLSFAINYLVSGLDPYWMKLTNLAIHLLNGLLVFLLARTLLLSDLFTRGALSLPSGTAGAALVDAASAEMGGDPAAGKSITAEAAPTARPQTHVGIVAALIAAGWLLLPINLTGVLYVVQRMESMANLFVLAGLIGYVAGRRRMLGLTPPSERRGTAKKGRFSAAGGGFLLCLISVSVPAALGILAKETAVMLPLYALLIEWAVFRFRAREPFAPREEGGVQRENDLGDAPYRASDDPSSDPAGHLLPEQEGKMDRRVVALFLIVLALPLVLGLAWLLPGILQPETWATRDFTLGTRLLSEARIVVDYIVWTLLPTPNALSFYHDNFRISTGLLAPWTTLASIVLLAALVALMLWLRPRRPLAALGIALFLGCQLLSGTILPLELIYEHRNYFASFGLLLALVPLLAAPARSSERATSVAMTGDQTGKGIATESTPTRANLANVPPSGKITTGDALPFALPRYVLLAGLLLSWTALTALTAYAWGNPLRLAADLAARAPLSPRAEYELGRTYILYSHYDPSSPFTRFAYAPLEKAAALPDASILPEQALIFMNARMHLPIKDAWWDSLLTKLRARKSTVQDESSLAALTQCVREHRCDLPEARMMEAFKAALSHPDPDARLLATYGDYAWNVLEDHPLGEQMTRAAVSANPGEPAYQITLVRMLAAQGRLDEARQALKNLKRLDIGGRIDSDIEDLSARIEGSKRG